MFKLVIFIFSIIPKIISFFGITIIIKILYLWYLFLVLMLSNTQFWRLATLPIWNDEYHRR